MLYRDCSILQSLFKETDRAARDNFPHFSRKTCYGYSLESPLRIVGTKESHPLIEPPHDKSDEMTCAPSEDSDQLGHPPVWSESSLSAWRNIWALTTCWVHSEDSDQTGWMPRLIWVFTGLTCHFIGFILRRLNYLQIPTLSISLLVLIKMS